VLPMFDDKGNVVAVIGHILNITGRKKMEQALRESQQRYQSIFENAPIGFYRTVPDGRILDANPALMEILGYSSFKDLYAVNLESSDYHPEYQRRLFRERIERDGEIKGMESFWKRSDNTLVYIRENARVIRDADGRVVCYEGTIEDISDQKKAEEYIHMLSRQLMQAQEGERQMLSRELHDTVAQDLSVAKMKCDLIYGELLKDRALEAQRVREIIGLLQKTIHGVRNMAYELRPPGLEELGLVETIYQFCEDFTQMWGVPVDFQSAGLKNLKLDHNIQINLYRLVQEGLTNIRKHAAASRVTVKLAAAFPNIIIRIEDNGRGFDVQKRAAAVGQEKRMGLRSMQERVKLMNGEMKLQSKPGQGTKVSIKLPIVEKKSGA
jgi:PAS domain S-box-containing protein